MPDTCMSDAEVRIRRLIDAGRITGGMVADAVARVNQHARRIGGLLHTPSGILFGRARTIRTESAGGPWLQREYIAEFYDSLQPGCIVYVQTLFFETQVDEQGLPSSVARHGTYWGEMLSRFAAHKGVAGTIVDGYSRDSTRIRSLGYPVWAMGWVGWDVGGPTRVGAVDETLYGDTRSGDLVFVDEDGAQTIPRHDEAAILTRLCALAEEEDRAQARIAAGATMAELQAEGFAL